MNLTIEEKYFVWLNSFIFLTPAKIKDFKAQFGTYQNVFKCAGERDSFFASALEKDEFNKFCYAATNEFVNSLFANLDKQKVGIVTKFNKNFTRFFKEKAPLTDADIFYYKGDLSLLDTKCIGVVGTRKPDVYGRRVTEDFVKILSKNGLTIVSGLAAGIDTVAHETALKNNGKTIAVLGGGFNHIYPTFNAHLADEIAKKGLIISEYAPQILPSAFHFPIRNRIIASISDGVLITQAGEKSGSMHTKNYAIDYGKELFIIPADLTRDASKGTNQVISQLPHACVISPEEILNRLGISSTSVAKQNIQLSIEEKLVLDAISTEETHFSELLSKTKMDSKTLSSLLTMMKVSGIIKQLPGNFYSK